MKVYVVLVENKKTNNTFMAEATRSKDRAEELIEWWESSPNYYAWLEVDTI